MMSQSCILCITDGPKPVNVTGEDRYVQSDIEKKLAGTERGGLSQMQLKATTAAILRSVWKLLQV